MVCEHLPVVFPAVLNIDDDNLLDPECELCEIVPLHGSSHISCGKVGPELTEVEPVFGCDEDVLIKASVAALHPRVQ